MRRPRLIALSSLAAAALLATACSSAGTSSGGSSGGASSGGATITVYNAQHEDLVKVMVAAFTKSTGIKVTMRNGDDSELSNQLVAEGSASPADVFLTENSPAMDLVDSKGLFAPVAAATLQGVPATNKPSSGNWTGWAARATVFAYSPAKVTTQPASLLDLAKPEWKGRFGISPSGADFQAVVSAVLSLKGEQATATWLAGLKANAKLVQGNSTIMKSINDGTLDAGVIYHYYWAKDRAESGANSSKVELTYFGKKDPGAFVSTSGAGVLKSSKKQADAQKFLAFLTSAAGQRVLAASTALEYPVANGVAANKALKPLAQLDAPTVDPGTLNGPKVVAMMRTAGLI